MGYHHSENLRVQRVPECSDNTSYREEKNVEGEDDNRDPVEPFAIIGQGI